MVGILLVSHYTFAESLKETVELIIGERKNLAAVSISKDDKIDFFSSKLKQAVDSLDEGDGVLILADMFGGSPSNVALSLYAKNDRVKIITGVNLPLVIEALMYSHKSLTELVKIIMEKKEKTIIDVKEIFNKGNK
ncbi:MAG: PTS sugar transporter subunit IIA [Candidatus Goldbacteria bacterium]|nr:PTS sugar transporter subunit IIA [Candidatus Goldiibacteriota bacterium]